MKRRSRTETEFKSPAVILGGLGINGYAIMRSLARMGVPVVGISNNIRDSGRFSKYCKGCYFYSPSLEDNRGYFYSSNSSDYEELCQQLIRWRSDFESNPVLFATGDAFAYLLANYAEQLAAHYEYHWVPMNTFSKILSKDQMSIVCQQGGILIPRTHITFPREDLLASALNFSFPCLIKPVHRAVEGFPMDKKNIVADSPSALIDFYAQHPGLAGKTIWQEIIEGGDENNFVCALLVQKSGEPTGVFCTRKLHQYPPYGVMCYGRSEQNDVVISEALKLVRFLGYRGIASLEFKYQPKDGRYYFIEMNTRSPRYNGLLPDAGVNLQYLTYLDLTGMADDRALQARQQNGLYWICARDQLKWCWKTREQHRPGLWYWLKLVAQADSYAYWNWRDPGPFLISGLQTLGAWLRRLSRIAQTFISKQSKAFFGFFGPGIRSFSRKVFGR